MKNIIFISVLAFTTVLFNSCEKVSQPYIIITELDTTLYPGNFYDYESPVFGENSNTLKNVLIEDFTGHKCSFCPAAAAEAHSIAANNESRVFIASIHASPSPAGVSDFQKVYQGHYTRDFTTTEGKKIAIYLSSVQGGVVGNPTGAINRLTSVTGEILRGAVNWSTITQDALITPLKVNIQAESNYYPETRGLFIHTESKFLEDVDGEYSIVVYAIQNQIIDWQLVGSVDKEFYHHNDVHIGNVYEGESFGRGIANGVITTGSKFQKDFSYKVPEGLTNSDMHFLIYVYDKNSNEILQVIKHEF